MILAVIATFNQEEALSSRGLIRKNFAKVCCELSALVVMRQWLCVCIEEESIDIRTWLFTDHLGPDPGHITTQTNGFQAVSFPSIWLGSEWWKTQSFDLTTIIPRNTFRNGLLKIIILQTLLHFVTCYGSLMLALWCNVQDTTDFHNIELSSGISTTNKILKITFKDNLSFINERNVL